MDYNGKHKQKYTDIQLPDLLDLDVPGLGLVKRSVSLVFHIFCFVIAIVFIVAFIVEINLTIDARGYLEPQEVHMVRPLETGIIKAVFVATGDTVCKGQLLAELDDFDILNQLTQAEHEHALKKMDLEAMKALLAIEKKQQETLISQSEANLIKAEALYRQRLAEHGFYERNDSLLRSYRVGNHVSLDIGYANVTSAKSDLQYNTAKGELLNQQIKALHFRKIELDFLNRKIQYFQEQIERYKIVSPAAGVILTEKIDFLTGSYTRKGDLLFELAELDQWQVKLFIGEKDIHKIHVGNPVKVKISALRSSDLDLFEGQVKSIGIESIAKSATSLFPQAAAYRVTVMLNDEQIQNIGTNKLKRGYLVEGEIITQSGKIIDILWAYLRELQ